MGDAARTETVDRQRDIAPGRNPGAPVFIDQSGILAAGGKQHDGGETAGAFGPPQKTPEVERQGAERDFDLLGRRDGGELGPAREAGAKESDEKRGDFEQAKRSDSGHETSPSSFSKLAQMALVEVAVLVVAL